MENEQHPEWADLPETEQKLLAAVDREIPGAFFPRCEINKLSPSFPYGHRYLANRMSEGTGPRESVMIGKKRHISKVSTLEMLASDLRKGRNRQNPR